MNLHLSMDTAGGEKNEIGQAMLAFNRTHMPAELRDRYQEVNVFLKSDEGHLYGGIVGEVCWNWLEIHYLFVDEQVRGQGYGQELLTAAITIARKKSCDFVKLDTLSFQALDFYTKQGFEIYGELPNAGGYTHYYLKKDL